MAMKKRIRAKSELATDCAPSTAVRNRAMTKPGAPRLNEKTTLAGRNVQPEDLPIFEKSLKRRFEYEHLTLNEMVGRMLTHFYAFNRLRQEYGCARAELFVVPMSASQLNYHTGKLRVERILDALPKDRTRRASRSNRKRLPNRSS
jgi:hypothetical protein